MRSAKADHSVGVNVVARYEALEWFYSAVGFSEDARWAKDRLEEIRE